VDIRRRCRSKLANALVRKTGQPSEICAGLRGGQRAARPACAPLYPPKTCGRACAPVYLRQIAYASCTNQPADATCPQYRALAPFPKKFLASRVTGNGKRFALRKGLAAVVDSSERTSKKLFGIFKGSSDTSLNIRYVFE
jgi:hypothetical protein